MSRRFGCTRALAGKSTWALLVVAGAVIAGCGLEPILGSGSGSGTDTAPSPSASGTQDTDAGILGGSCGVEPGTSAVLCRNVNTCPTVVVDAQAMPHCGFRIRGSIAELVCGCGDSICSMGAFTTCEQAQRLLNTQTEQGTCVQVADQRCEPGTASPASSTGTGANDPNPPANGPTCDRQCMSECGGGSACASICECH